jgi:hypothetical protein
VAVITFVGRDFSMDVPAEWRRLATADHVAVFLGVECCGVRPSMTLSRFEGSAGRAAAAARADHAARFPGYEVLREWQPDLQSTRRSYRWVRHGARPIIQHQLFVDGVVLTCSRSDSSSCESAEEVFQVALGSLSVSQRAL